MKFEDEIERGIVAEEAEVVNEGEYIAYAEGRYGPWGVQFRRASNGTIGTHPSDERIIEIR